MSILEHIVLYILLFSLFFYWGKYCYNLRPTLSFWLTSLVPIFSYSFIVGSRYGWGVDYLWYKKKFENPLLAADDEFIFRCLNSVIRYLGFSYVGAFIIYSFILVLVAFIVIRSYDQDSKYMYAFFIPATLLFTTNIIRQGVAYAFVLLFIFFLNKKSWIGCILSCLIGILIHSATVISIAIILLIYLAFDKPLSLKITIPVYVFFTFFFDMSKIAFISEYIDTFSIGGKYQEYIADADRWFGTEAINDIYTQSSIALFLMALFHIGFMLIGNVILSILPKKNIVYLYNVSVIGMIFFRAVFNIEIMRRFAIPLYILYFIPLGYFIFLIFNTNMIKPSFIRLYANIGNKGPFIFKYAIYVIIAYLLIYNARFVFFNIEGLFFWNK